MRTKFKNANEAFEYLYGSVSRNGIDFAGTKALFNVGFELENPMNNKITNSTRNWKESYAEYEFQWYLAGDPNGEEISKRAIC